MKRKIVGIGVVALAAVVVGVAPDAQQQAADGANAVMPWAYTLNAPAPSAGGTTPDPNEVLRVPGSSVTFMRSQMRDLFNPPDWHPDNHPAMPPVVANGRAPDVRACGFAISRTVEDARRTRASPSAGARPRAGHHQPVTQRRRASAADRGAERRVVGPDGRGCGEPHPGGHREHRGVHREPRPLER